MQHTTNPLITLNAPNYSRLMGVEAQNCKPSSVHDFGGNIDLTIEVGSGPITVTQDQEAKCGIMHINLFDNITTPVPSFVQNLSTAVVFNPTEISQVGVYTIPFYLNLVSYPELDYSSDVITYTLTVAVCPINRLEFAYTDATNTLTVDSMVPDIFYMTGEESLTQSLKFLTYRNIPERCT